MQRRLLLVVLAVAVVAAGTWWAGNWLRPRAVWSPPMYGSPAGYVGSAACASCHAAISASFEKSQMAQSWSAVADSEPIEEPGEVHDPGLNLHYRMERRDGRLFVQEYRLAESGETVHSLEVEARYAIGSGLHGRSYAAEQQGYLTTLPVGWYSDASEWRLAPGYEEVNQRFDRPVPAQCVGCHSAEPAYITGSGNRFRLPLPDGIGCEKCHGPGAEHVAARQRGAGTLPDQSIVNPARLAPDLQQDVCLQCHLQGEIAVTQPGRGLFDYRPGQRLRDFRSDFFLSSEGDDQPGSVSHVPRSMQSLCFRSSGGRLTCVQCHDPHLPLGDVPAGFYNARCLNCHSERGCSRPLEVEERPRDGDCVACHMPRVGSGDIGHAVTTEHWIQRRPHAGPIKFSSAGPGRDPALLPRGFWGDETTGQIGSAVVMAPVYWSRPERLAEGVRLLEGAVREHPQAHDWQYRLGMGYFHAQRWDDARQTLEDLLRSAPDMTEARELLGRVYLRLGRLPLAEQAFEEMLRRNPDCTTADQDLALLYFDLNRPERLLEQLDTTMSHHPQNAMLNALAAKATMTKGQDTGRALELLEEAERLNPTVAVPYVLEAQIALEQRDTTRAERALRGALRAQADFHMARMALARLLARTGRRDEAITELERVLDRDPVQSQAREMLKDLKNAP